MRFLLILLAVGLLFATPVSAALRVGTGVSVDYGINSKVARSDMGEINLVANGSWTFSHFLLDFEQAGNVNMPSALGLSWIVKGSKEDPDFFAGLKSTTRWLEDGAVLGLGPQLGVIVADKVKLGLVVSWYPGDNDWRVAYENTIVLKPIW